MYRYDVVLFDLDGTITDSAPGILTCVRYALEKFGIYEKDEEKLRRFMGPPLMDSFQEFYGFSYEKAQAATAEYRVRYNAGEIYHCEVYPGIPDLLRKLRQAGIRTALATSKPETMAISILSHFGLLELFDVVVGAGMDDHVRHSKTEVVEEALIRLGRNNDRNRILMVGDRKFDMQGASDCFIDSMGVYYGYAEPGELERAGAAHLCSSVEDLGQFILMESE